MSNIETIRNDSDFIMYKTTCDCMDDNHDLTLCLEKDEDLILLSLYQAMWIRKENIIDRIKYACSILFKGELQVEGGFIFRGKEHIQDLVENLNKAMEKLDV